ncbi:hypothetical protein HMPREF0322_01907 [Desulfitobacterium hafniense DP7]|uniref:Uncharacterized protein n=1 Tax=Desulfitobacterium hafniense DP7 TaxID=537010 RepID=G9XLS2_DESHA|nr:hypothetical protein HMPREF0322_01907 [Desulfitobacterium hafniense DP7]
MSNFLFGGRQLSSPRHDFNISFPQVKINYPEFCPEKDFS